MKFIKNKKFKLYILSLSLSAGIFLGLVAPAIVYAGDPTVKDPTVGLCNKGGVVTQINLNITSESQACLNGGKIIHAGEKTPVDLCITQSGQSATIKQISAAEKASCKGAGVYVWPAGKALPKFVASADPAATTGGTTAPPASCSSDVGKAPSDTSKCEVAQDCTNGQLDESHCQITKYLRIFINILSGMVGIAVIGSLVLGGIQYTTSAGDPNAAAAAKKRISNAVLALVAFGLMYGFLQWVVPGGVL